MTDQGIIWGRIIFYSLAFFTIIGIIKVFIDSCKPYCIKLCKFICYLIKLLIYRKTAIVIPIEQATVTDRTINSFAFQVPLSEVVILT
jgi:hypothetical protein